MAISPIDKESALFSSHSCRVSCTTVLTAVIFIVSLVVIFSCLLCLTLPGVNVHSDILPILLYAIGGVVLGIGTLILNVKDARRKEKTQTRLITLLRPIIDAAATPTCDVKTVGESLANTLLPRSLHGGTRGALLTALEDRIKEEKCEKTRETHLLAVLKETKTAISKQKD